MILNMSEALFLSTATVENPSSRVLKKYCFWAWVVGCVKVKKNEVLYVCALWSLCTCTHICMCHGNQSLKMPKGMKVMELVWIVQHRLGLRHWSEKNDLWYQKRAIWHGWRLKQRKVGGGGPGTDEEAWTPTQSRESGSWSWWIQTADNDIMCQVTPKWAAQCSMQVQANITLEFQKEWKHCSALSCVLYGKSRRKTCRPLLPLVNSFSFSH